MLIFVLASSPQESGVFHLPYTAASTSSLCPCTPLRQARLLSTERASPQCGSTALPTPAPSLGAPRFHSHVLVYVVYVFVSGVERGMSKSYTITDFNVLMP